MGKIYSIDSQMSFHPANDRHAGSSDVFTDVAGGAMRLWMQPPTSAKTMRMVDANQLTSLSAMIAYVSSSSGQNEFTIERGLADHFNVPNAKCLPAHKFENALRYLVDMV